MSISCLRHSTHWALVAALVLGGGAMAQAEDAAQPAGKIVRIAPPADNGAAANVVPNNASNGQLQFNAPQQPELPQYWIGILGGPVPEMLQAQLDLPQDHGVLVREVVPGSPAEKAGLKNFDIVVQANGADLADITQLSELVKSQGASGGKISLDVLRRGQHQTLDVTPESRPEPAVNSPGRGGQPFQFPMFGPGAAFQQQFNLSQMPNGLSVNIQKENDEPAHITVQRGNDTWNIVGDDPSALAQLPDDVRPFVEKMLSGNQLQSQMPPMPNLPNFGFQGRGFNQNGLHQQLHAMEQQLQEMQQQMEQQFGQPHSGTDAQPNTQ